MADFLIDLAKFAATWIAFFVAGTALTLAGIWLLGRAGSMFGY